MLAGFLGHDIHVHRKFYRLPQSALEVAKIGKLMMLMEKGGIGKVQGRSLDDIDIDLEVDGEY